MLSFRRKFGAKLNRLAGGFGSSAGMASAPSGGDSDVRSANKLYFATLVIIVVTTFVLLIVGGNTVSIQAVLAALWGLFLGGTFLFYLHKKLIITIFGAMLGASAGDIKSVVESIQNFTHTAQQLTDALNKAFNSPPQIYNGSMFLFLVLLLLSCLPAYSE